eukprot:EG_transcript_53015
MAPASSACSRAELNHLWAALERLCVTEATTWCFEYDTFTPEGGLCLMDALRLNTTLRELRLPNQRLGPEGARSLAATVNTTLQSLDLRANAIGPEGAKALAEARAALLNGGRLP